MATIVFTKLQAELAKLGIDTAEQAGSNVKKAFTGGKSTSTKPGLLAAERDTGGNFATVLDTFKNDAKYIGTMNDVEQMAFLNNIMDYNEFGGKSIRTSEGIKALDEAKNLETESGDLQSAIDNLTNKAKSMQDEAAENLKSAEDDVNTFFETGGDPFKKKDKKFLGGSMAEEGQVRTGIREFLKKEYKNGRINLDKKDIERVMKYSGLSKDDPILVFKKLYGDEAYKKAGSFPGAFDIGENYNQYEEIFRKNMGEDILKVKDSKYAGDGKLVLSESEEVRTPIKDEDVPFATGGRASFAGGKVIDELVAMLVKKEPMEAMKEVNKIIGKKGKYKNLTQKDIDRIVDQTNDHIFQRDPDNLFVEDRPMFKKETDIDLEDVDLSQGMIDLDELNFTKNAKAAKNKIDNTSVNKEIKEGVAEILSDTSPEALQASIEIDNLMLKYPGMDKLLARQIATDTNPKRKADVIAMVEQTFELDKQGKSGSEIIDIFKKTPRTEQADGGITQLRNGYYGGGQAMVGEDLSDIGHGSDSLMARNMQVAPGSQATTSTGLNYLLGQDNDTARVPYKDAGPVVLPKEKPNSDFKSLLKIYNTYKDSMPGVSEDTQKYLAQDFINKLNEKGLSQTQFQTLRMQNHYEESKADGGRAAFGGGGTMGKEDRGYQGGGRDKEGNVSGTAPGAAEVGGGPDDRGSDRQNYVQDLVNAGYTAKQINSITNPNVIDRIKNSKYNNPYTRGILKAGMYAYNPKVLGTDLRKLTELKDLYKKTNSMINNPIFEEEDMTLGLTIDGGILNNPFMESQVGPAITRAENKYYEKGEFPSEFLGDRIRMNMYTGNEEGKFGPGFADGGIAGLRIGYAGGKGVDIARRGFLKILGGSVAAATAFKMGLVKMLGKESGAVSKKAVDQFFASGTSGAPSWFEPLVNKALREGLDITEKAAVKDGQIVKQLDTPTGKVDVTYDTRTGAVDVDYMGSDTALGEGLNMRYAPGDIIEEGANMGKKTDDVFEAVEAVPEMQGFNYDDVELAFGENLSSNVDDLYSNTSELKKLGGEKMLVKDISNTLKKKKVLKDMDRDPMGFANDQLEATGIPADPPHDALTKIRYHSE